MTRPDDDDAPTPASGSLTQSQAQRLLFRDPAVRNYLFAALAALVIVFAVMMQRLADVGGLLLVMIGVVGLLFRKPACPPLFVLLLVYFAVFPSGLPFDLPPRDVFAIEDNRFNFSDLMLAGAALVYLACQYRVLGLTEQALPHEMRLPRAVDKAYRRPPAAIRDLEVLQLVYVAAAVVFAGQLLWLLVTNLEVDVGATIPLRLATTRRGGLAQSEGLPPGATRFVLITGGLFFAVMLGRLVFGYWRLRAMKPDEAAMTLLDTGWVETRREHVRGEAWRKWRRDKIAAGEKKRYADRRKADKRGAGR